MEVAACSRDGRMAERRLDEMDRSAAIEAMRCVGMSEPMGRDRARQLGSFRRRLDDAMHLGRIEMPAL